MPRPIAIIDAETDPFERGLFPEPFIWGYYDEEVDFKIFNETKELIEFVETRKVIVYAHNGGKFDYHFILDHLYPYEEISIIAGRIAKFKIGLAEFRDSYSILPIRLASYKKDDMDYEIMKKANRNLPENRAKIIKYLRSDCKYLFELISAYRSEFGNKLTLAGGAMAYWEKITCDKVPKSDQNYYDSMSKYYYGGRVECFEGGVIEDDFKVIDINSAYPRAMLEEHPYGLEHDIVTNKRELKTDPIFEQSFYTVQCISQGCFPFRKDDGSLFFPNDLKRRTYHITGWELKAAIEESAVFGLVISKRVDFFHCRDFKVYILPFYERKKKAGEILDELEERFDNGELSNEEEERYYAARREYIFCKLKMNSLYGKFAANPENYSNYIVVPPSNVADMTAAKRGDDIDVDNYEFGGQLGPWVLGVGELEANQKRYYNVATAASITGFVRAYLWKAIKKCDGVMYCDTDSIAAKVIGDIPMGKELGEWECEGDFNLAGIGGKKLYVFRNTITGKTKKACKGVNLNEDEIMRVARGETVKYESIAPSYSVYKAPCFVDRDIRMNI